MVLNIQPTAEQRPPHIGNGVAKPRGRRKKDEATLALTPGEIAALPAAVEPEEPEAPAVVEAARPVDETVLAVDADPAPAAQDIAPDAWPDEPPVAIQIVADTAAGDLRDVMLEELKRQHDRPWNMRTEGEQTRLVGVIERVCRDTVYKLVDAIAAAGQPVIKAELLQVTIKDGAKAVLEISRHDPNRHALFDCVGGESLMIVLADPKRYTGERAGIKIAPDQADLIRAVEQVRENEHHEDHGTGLVAALPFGGTPSEPTPSGTDTTAIMPTIDHEADDGDDGVPYPGDAGPDAKALAEEDYLADEAAADEWGAGLGSSEEAGM
jgi:hypothetical protein